jgi:hypothetical protein
MYENYDEMSLQDLAKAFLDIKEKLEKAKQESSALQNEWDHIRLNKIPELMDEEGVNTVTFKGVGRITLTADVYASIPADKKEDAYEWLRSNGHSGIIQESVHNGTLRATIKALMKKGDDVPGDFFKVTPYSRASVTRIKGGDA